MKVIKIISVLLALCSLNSFSCQRYPEFGGDQSTNNDCQTQFAKVFKNEARAPQKDVMNKVFQKRENVSSSNVKLGMIATTHGSLWLIGCGVDTAECLEFASKTQFKALIVNGSGLYSDETKNEANFYVVRQWKNYLLSWYGSAENFPNDIADIEARISITDVTTDLLYNESMSEAEALEAITSSSPKDISIGFTNLINYISKSNTKIILPLLDIIQAENEIFVELKAIALTKLLALNDERVNNVSQKISNDFRTRTELKNVILINGKYAGINNFVAKTIRLGPTNPNFRIALERAIDDKNLEAVIPLIDLAVPQTKRESLIMVVYTLGEIGSDRALVALKNPDLYDSSDSSVRSHVRDAVEKIENQFFKLIIKGDRNAIDWSKEIIQNNDGMKRKLIMKILDTYKTSTLIPKKIKIELKLFLENEISLGYHDYDQKLIEEMQSTIVSLGAK